MLRVLVFGSVFAIVGALALLGARRLYRRHRDVLDRFDTTSGQVVEIVSSDVDGQTMYQPVVELVLPGREPIRVTDSAYHAESKWQVGEPHVIYYNPHSPTTAQLSLETGYQFGAHLIGIFGITFTAIGLAGLLAYVLGPDSTFGGFVARALE